jgi:hypothetical protein
MASAPDMSHRRLAIGCPSYALDPAHFERNADNIDTRLFYAQEFLLGRLGQR